jgi:hypothetical protein
MIAQVRIELLELAVNRYTHDVVAEFLSVPLEDLYGWLLGQKLLPDPVLLALVDLMDPKPDPQPLRR